MNDERVFQILAEINPVPDLDQLDALHALTEDEIRRGTMVTTDRTTETIDRTTTRSGMRVAAVSALLVLLAGVGAWWATGNGDEVADPIVVAETYMEARSTNDPEAALAVLSPTADLTGEVPPVGDTSELLDMFAGLVTYGVDTPYECAPTADPGVVACEYWHSDRLTRAQFRGEFRGRMVIVVGDRLVTSVVNEFPFGTYSPNAWEPFALWLRDEHEGAPEEYFDLTDNSMYLKPSEEARTALRGFLDEFEASLRQ